MAIVERLVLSLVLASTIAYVTTPLAIAAANRMRFFDLPAGYKSHVRPTPYLGGAAVMAGFLAALLLSAGHWDKTAPLIAGVALLWLVGTVDDRRTVSPWLRVIVEIALAWLAWESGLGWRLHMGAAVDLALTCAWLVGVINAFNLFDNMDGAASTMALAVSAGAALLGVVRDDVWLAVGAASLGGACLGFLPRNLALPARIFLGDGGSMPVGFVAAVLVMVAAGTSSSAWQSLPVALLLVGLPALDTTLVIVSRRRRGVPVMAGGKDHLTHRARRFMPSARAVALALGGAQAVVSVVAVLAAEGGASFVVVAAIVYTLAGLAAIAVLEGRGVEAERAHPSERADAAEPATAARATDVSIAAGPRTVDPRVTERPSSGPPATGPRGRHPATGHTATGHTATGHPATGHPATGHPATGHPATGHPATGHTATGHTATGHTATGHPATGHPATVRSDAPRAPGGDGLPLGTAMLAVLGLGAGLSAFAFAYYDASVWAPVGLGLVLLCAIGVVARPPVPTGPAALAIGAVLGTGVWSLCSTVWTRSVEGATVTGDRWLAYGALLVLLVVLIRGRRRAVVALSAAGGGVVAVALSVLARLLGADPAALFLGGRLNEPLGYINGEGCLFAMGFWLCMAAAESRRALLAGPAMALATLMACLALLSQSRGTALAMLFALAAVMTLLPGRARRAYALALASAALALAGPALLHVYDSAAAGAVSLRASHAAGRAALLAALGAGAVWGGATRAWEAVRSGRLVLSGLRMAASWALAAPALAALALAAGSAHSIEREVSAQWRAFTHLAPPAGAATQSPHHAAAAQPTRDAASMHARRQAVATRPARRGGAAAPVESSSESRSRLLSGAGNRYDYWRIAWSLWTERPLVGVGAGSYASFYYERRSTTEDVDQPHSIELEALSELGLVGGALLASLFAAAAWGAFRLRRLARSSLAARAAAVAATGSFVAWAAQTSVDWMHLLPGVTALALIGVASLVWPWPRAAGSPPAAHGALPGAADGAARATDDRPRAVRARAHARRLRVVGMCVVLATMVVAGASLSRQSLAQLYADRAQRELDARPAAALTDAERALDLDSDAVRTYYLEAAALARFDQAPAAEAALRRALSHEPRNFVTWALLGDIAVREGRLAVARIDYLRAHALNPRNAALDALTAAQGAATQ